jgi:hypothetical protein
VRSEITPSSAIGRTLHLAKKTAIYRGFPL